MSNRPNRKELWYLRGRASESRTATIVGLLMAFGLNATLLGAISFSGFKYIYPPPAEDSFVLDFTVEEYEKPKEIVSDKQAVVEEPDKEQAQEFVKESKSPTQGTKPSQAPESTVGNKGDVEVLEPPKLEIDQKALFTNPNNNNPKDTLAQHTARDVSDALEKGNPKGNIENGNPDGTPNAHLKGRTALPGIPRPDYPVQKDGIVVVEIYVDQAGNVIKADAGFTGTTIADTKLWKAAEKAALKTKFNKDDNAAKAQKGTITYIFKLTTNQNQ